LTRRQTAQPEKSRLNDPVNSKTAAQIPTGKTQPPKHGMAAQIAAVRALLRLERRIIAIAPNNITIPATNAIKAPTISPITRGIASAGILTAV